MPVFSRMPASIAMAGTKVKEKRFGPCPLGFEMVTHAPSANSGAMHWIGKDVRTTIRFQIPGVRTERIDFEGGKIVSVTIHTPIDDASTWFTHLLYLPRKLRFRLARPLLRRFGKAFVGQDVAMFRRLGEAWEEGPAPILVGEVDHQFRWYRQLKADYAAAADKSAVVPTLDKTLLRWRT